jgi:hypothetical protein
MPTRTAVSKRKLGIYYTPHTAAQILAEWAIRSPQDAVLEPSFGGCALLKGAVARLQEIGCKNSGDLLFGFDLDPDAFLYLGELVQKRDNRKFKKQDFLRSRPQAPMVSAVLANPPFVSYRRMSKKQRSTVQQWSEKYGWPFAQDAGLWSYFLMHSLNFLKPGGRIAFILPSSASQADYAAPMRDFIASKFKSVHLFSINQQLFIQEGAVERTTILLAEEFLAEGNSSLRYSAVSDLDELAAHISGAEHICASRTSADISSYLKSPGSTFTLGSVARITIGEVIGDVRFLVRDNDDWDTLGVSNRHRKPIVQGAATLQGLIVTKDDADHLPMLLQPPPDRLPAKLQSYLDTYPPEKIKKNSTFSKRPCWYKATYTNDASGFIPSVSGSGIRFVVNDASVSCTNSAYKVYPVQNSNWSPESLAIAFQSTLTQLSAEILSRTLGSGGLKLEPSDLARLVLPSTTSTIKPKEAKKILEQMDDMFRQGDKDGIRRLADRILLLDSRIISPTSYELLMKDLQRLQQLRKKTLSA